MNIRNAFVTALSAAALAVIAVYGAVTLNSKTQAGSPSSGFASPAPGSAAAEIEVATLANASCPYLESHSTVGAAHAAMPVDGALGSLARFEAALTSADEMACCAEPAPAAAMAHADDDCCPAEAAAP